MAALRVNAEIEKTVECFTQCILIRHPEIVSGWRNLDVRL